MPLPSQPSIPLPWYRSHKRVRAAKIVTVNGTRLTIEADGRRDIIVVDDKMLVRYTPVPGDFYVLYRDNYASISPRSEFDDGYKREAEVVG
jgi:hypothetical protein